VIIVLRIVKPSIAPGVKPFRSCIWLFLAVRGLRVADSVNRVLQGISPKTMQFCGAAVIRQVVLHYLLHYFVSSLWVDATIYP